MSLEKDIVKEIIKRANEIHRKMEQGEIEIARYIIWEN